VIGTILLSVALSGIPRVYTAGTDVSGYTEVPPPAIEMRMDVASATSVPWIDANGWRFIRGLKKAFYSKLPAGSASLAAAEAYAYGVDAILESAPQDAAALERMQQFLREIDAPALPVRAQVGLVDDGSDEMAEVMVLLSRRNLLFRVLKQPDPKLDVNVRLGSREFPKGAAEDPNEFAARIRSRIGDENRLIRIFNTYTVLAHLTGDAQSARLHLLNYAKRPARDVRVRVLGSYEEVHLAEANNSTMKAMDIAVEHGGTEFTVPRIDTYAVIDLERTKKTKR
jgi:hypothetical protein